MLRLRGACVAGHRFCYDQCSVAYQVEKGAAEKPCACYTSVNHYHRGPYQLGYDDMEKASDRKRDCAGMAMEIVCACGGTEKESDSIRGSCVLTRSMYVLRACIHKIGSYHDYPKSRPVRRPCLSR